MQEMWKFKIDWDQPVLHEMHDDWKKYLHELESLQELFIFCFVCTKEVWLKLIL